MEQGTGTLIIVPVLINNPLPGLVSISFMCTCSLFSIGLHDHNTSPSSPAGFLPAVPSLFRGRLSHLQLCDFQRPKCMPALPVNHRLNVNHRHISLISMVPYYFSLTHRLPAAPEAWVRVVVFWCFLIQLMKAPIGFLQFQLRSTYAPLENKHVSSSVQNLGMPCVCVFYPRFKGSWIGAGGSVTSQSKG